MNHTSDPYEIHPDIRFPHPIESVGSVGSVEVPVEVMTWQVIIHLTFVVSAVALAFIDRIGRSPIPGKGVPAAITQPPAGDLATANNTSSDKSVL